VRDGLVEKKPVHPRGIAHGFLRRSHPQKPKESDLAITQAIQWVAAVLVLLVQQLQELLAWDAGGRHLGMAAVRRVLHHVVLNALACSAPNTYTHTHTHIHGPDSEQPRPRSHNSLI
jgi:hypothetical protein